MYVYECVCGCTWVRARLCVGACTSMCTCVRLFVCVARVRGCACVYECVRDACMHVCKRAGMHVWTCARVCTCGVCTCVCTCVCMCVRVREHVCVRVCVHVCMCVL